MKRVYYMALVLALLCTGCSKTNKVEATKETSAEDTAVQSTTEGKESVERTRVFGAFTVYYDSYIPDKNTNGTTNVAMIVYDFQNYPYTIPYLVDAQHELEPNKPYTFTIEDKIIEESKEDLEKMTLSSLLWEYGDFEVVSFREANEDEWGVEQGGLQFESIDEKTYLEQYTLKMPTIKTIDEYFVDPHEHESCEDGYTKEVDLNNDGKNEKIVVEKLECNGGDGGYFPHVYSASEEELVYQEDVYDSPFEIKWNKGAASIFYNGEPLVEFTKENVKEIYFTQKNNEYYDLSDLEETIMTAYDNISDPPSGFVVTDDGQLLVKYYISGAYGHSDTIGYGILHMTLDKDNKWTIKPEFVFDNE